MLALKIGVLLDLVAVWRRPSCRLKDGAWRTAWPYNQAGVALAPMVEAGAPFGLVAM
jgi:hypothetical protein